MDTRRWSYSRLVVPLVVVLLGGLAAFAIAVLQNRADSSRRDQLVIGGMRYALQSLGSAPFESSPQSGGSPGFARSLMSADEDQISRSLVRLERGSAPRFLHQVAPVMAAMKSVNDRIFWIGAYGGGYNGPHASEISPLSVRQVRQLSIVDGLLSRASRTYATRASVAKTEATSGSLLSIAALLVIFALFYRRSLRARDEARRLAAENARLLDASREEAITDSLTELPNRRALVADLEAWFARARPDEQAVLALFDLNGFKEYNDTFGHVAGDALLSRFGERLSASLGGCGKAYRMGGDEFCVFAASEGRSGVELIESAAAALNEHGPAFAVGCSYGVAELPHDARAVSDALRVADSRMYEQKANGRSSAQRQSTDVLLAALAERDPDLHAPTVAGSMLAELVARDLGLDDHEARRVGLAAQLRDVGKLAIPDSILTKQGPLTDAEWGFIRRHAEVGQRIVSAAPSLRAVAELVLSSHERHDGRGYPRGLVGDEIPLGASIVAVCDAFEAMTSPRPYRASLAAAEAQEELRRCAGSQFRPDVVESFCTVLSRQATLMATPA